MKNILVFIFVFTIGYCYSQQKYTYKAIYELSYKTDSTSNFYETSNFVLLINNKESFFQNYNSYKRDSIKSQELIASSSIVKDEIKTKINTKSIEVSQEFSGLKMYYVESIPNQWKITNNVIKFNEISCKEATLNCYGRNWIAYFSEDYSFQFGPYLFSGLPGLIVKIEDDHHFYNFRLLSLKKEENTVKFDNSSKEISKIKYYQMIYDAFYSGNIFNSFKMQDANEQEAIRKKFMDRIKKLNNIPIDKTMRYIFD